jgi:hypothetical protein
MTYNQKVNAVSGVKSQSEPKKGQVTLVVRFTNGKEFNVYCTEDEANDKAKSIKQSLCDIESINMVR